MMCGKKNFPGKSDVLFQEFFKAMKSTLQFTPPSQSPEDVSIEYFVLRELFSKKMDSLEKNPPFIVKLENFGKTIPYFGRMDTCQYMKTVVDIMRLPGFYGNISTEEVEKELKSQGKEGYLIRFSSSTVGAFVLSTYKKGKITQIKVDSNALGFSSEITIQKKGKKENKKFENKTLKKLVAEVVAQLKIKSEPTSPFQWIFNPKDRPKEDNDPSTNFYNNVVEM